MIDALELAIAHKHVLDYARDAICAGRHLDQHAACERRLEQGIEAYRSIAKAEETMRQAAHDAPSDSPELDAALESLYRGWLAPCEHAEALARQQLDQGCELEKLSAFRACCESVRDWIERHEWAKASKASRDRRFQSEPW